jgi:hypothetical protein
MQTEDEVKIHARKMFDEGFRNPSAIAAISYYKGCEWRFDKLRAFCDQEVKNYSQELSRNKLKTTI